MICGDIAIFVNTDIIEMSGSERIVYFELNGSKCSAKIPLEYNCSNKLELKIAVKDMYFFDNQTGENLLYEKV